MEQTVAATVDESVGLRRGCLSWWNCRGLESGCLVPIHGLNHGRLSRGVGWSLWCSLFFRLLLLARACGRAICGAGRFLLGFSRLPRFLLLWFVVDDGVTVSIKLLLSGSLDLGLPVAISSSRSSLSLCGRCRSVRLLCSCLTGSCRSWTNNTFTKSRMCWMRDADNVGCVVRRLRRVRKR